MREYALLTLNLIEYDGIYLKKQSVEYARLILNVSDAVHSIRSLYNLPSSYPRLRWSVLQKGECRVQVRNQRFFRAGGGGRQWFWNFDKHFAKNTRKRVLLEFFLLDALKTTF